MEAGFKADVAAFEKRIWNLNREITTNPGALSWDDKQKFAVLKRQWAAAKAQDSLAQPDTTVFSDKSGQASMTGVMTYLEGQLAPAPMFSTPVKVGAGAVVLGGLWWLFKGRR